jgi:hypothetical protein
MSSAARSACVGSACEPALDAAGHDALLFASRGENVRGYYGTAMLGEAVPDASDRGSYWLPGAGEMPFYTYSHPIRLVAEEHYRGLATLGAIANGFGEQEAQRFEPSPLPRVTLKPVRYRELRFEMIDVYGPRCAFIRCSFPSLNGLAFGTDVGHLWPRSAGGPESIQNVLPMSKDVNNQWDQGLISLTNSGDLLIARQAGRDTRALFANFERIEFPRNVQFWPDARYLERHRDEIFEKGPKWLPLADSSFRL